MTISTIALRQKGVHLQSGEVTTFGLTESQRP